MSVRIVIPKETHPGEKRVAVVPELLSKFAQNGFELCIESNAAQGLGLNDSAYAAIEVRSRAKLFENANIVLRVQPPTIDEIKEYPEGTVLVSFMQPHSGDERIKVLKERKITSFAMELIPRISRAQSLDALSSQASIAGYKAVIMAADKITKFFPMLTTAAGTIRPGRVLIIGAGVAGLQAIATAKRLGAIVEAYDVRAATKEQVESLGAKFVDVGMKAEGQGGYARDLTEEEKTKQRDILAQHVAKADVIIATAAIPGRASPRIIDQAMVDNMRPGAVIIDLAAEGGGNCALTQAGEEIVYNGVTILGPLNLASSLAVNASEMYAKNLYNFLLLMVKNGELQLDWKDQIIADSALTHDGEIKYGPAKDRIEGKQ